MVLGLWIACFVVVVDQLSKFWVLNYIVHETPVLPVFPFFNVVKAWNTGVSFSMFNNGGVWGMIGLSALALGIVVFLLNWLRKESNRYVQIALGLIIGGAIGNVIDRIRLGAVFDFLDFHLQGHHWPAFNAADSFICLGAVFIIVHGLLYHDKVQGDKNENK